MSNSVGGSKVVQVQQLKQQLGSWMFRIMSNMSREQFGLLLKMMHSDQELADFRSRLGQARKTFKQLQQSCTQKQQPYIAKPFFYSIRYIEETHENAEQMVFEMTLDEDEEIEDSKSDLEKKTSTPVEGTSPSLMPAHDRSQLAVKILAFDIDALTRKQANVSKFIPTQREFNLYVQILSDVLQQDKQQNDAILRQMQQEQVAISKAVKSQRSLFKRIKDRRQAAQSNKKDESSAALVLNTARQQTTGEGGNDSDEESSHTLLLDEDSPTDKNDDQSPGKGPSSFALAAKKARADLPGGVKNIPAGEMKTRKQTEAATTFLREARASIRK